MSDRLEQLKTELRSHLTTMRDTAAKAEAEGRDFTAEERATLAELTEKAQPIREQIDRIKSDASLAKAIGDLGAGIGIVDPAPAVEAEVYASLAKGKSIGDAFVDSPEFKSFINATMSNGRIPEKARVQSLPVGYKSLLAGADVDSAGAFVNTDFTGIFEPLGRRPLTLRDIISVRQTTSDTVEYVRQVSRVQAAAPVPEASISSAVPDSDPSNTAGVKPEGGMEFEKVPATVITIAEWVPATRRALADAAQLRGLIDQELRDDLREAEEDQIVTGAGTGENLTGILATEGIQTQDFESDIFVTVRKALTKVRTIGRSIPTAVLLHPEDDESIDLERDGEDRFYGAGPWALGPQSLWGIPRVVSEAVPAGTAVVGDFRKAVLWDREQATVSVTDSHADFFIRNLVAVLAEERVAFGVIRPTAFVEVDLGGS